MPKLGAEIMAAKKAMSPSAWRKAKIEEAIYPSL